MFTDSFDPERALEHADDLARRAKEMEAEAKETEIDVTSPDKSVTVTTSLTGRVVDLKLHREAVEGRSHQALSAAILATIKHAQDASQQAAKDLADRYLPEASRLRGLFQSRGGLGQERP